MRKILSILLVMYFFLTGLPNLQAQCSMCKASVESNINNSEKTVGKGLNTGILYLMAIPYLLGGVGVGIYFWNRNRVKVPFN